MNGLSSLQRITLLIIIIAGAFLRFHNYYGWSLSNDELSALNRLHYNSFSEVIEEGVKLNDMHPPGVQAFLYLWTWFGVYEKLLRLPFVLFGIASIYLFFLVAKNWFNNNTALLASASFATLIFPILYSQLARPYSPGLFFTLLAVLCWTKLVFKTEEKRFDPGYYVGFIIAGAACMYIHYFSFLFVAIIGITGLFFIKGKLRIWYVAAGGLMFLLLTPSINVFLYQVGIGGLGGSGGWLGPPKADAIIALIWYIFNESFYLLCFYLIISVYLIFYLQNETTFNVFRRLSLIFFLLPFIIAFFYSIFKNPVYQHSIMIFSFPYLLLFIFSYLPENFSAKHTFYSVLIVLVVTGFSTVAEKKFYSRQYFGVFKELAEKSTEYQQKLGDKNVTAVANVIFPYYINYYHNQFHTPSKYQLYNCSTPAQLEKLNKIARESATPYLSYVWSNTANPEEVQQIVSQYYPKLVERIDYFNSGVRLFAKEDVNVTGYLFQPQFSYIDDFEKPGADYDSLLLSNDVKFGGNKSVLFTNEKEFGPTFKCKLKDVNFKDSSAVWIKIWIYAEEIPAKAILVLQVDDGGKTVLWRGADVKDYVLKPLTWQPVFLAYRFSETLSADATISAYVWNPGKEKFYADDFSVTVIH